MGNKKLSKFFKNPTMAGWINEAEGIVKSISVKKPFKLKKSIPIVLGISTFKDIKISDLTLKSLFRENDKINDEFYIDSSINHAIKLGYNAAILK